MTTPVFHIGCFKQGLCQSISTLGTFQWWCRAFRIPGYVMLQTPYRSGYRYPESDQDFALNRRVIAHLVALCGKPVVVRKVVLILARKQARGLRAPGSGPHSTRVVNMDKFLLYLQTAPQASAAVMTVELTRSTNSVTSTSHVPSEVC